MTKSKLRTDLNLSEAVEDYLKTIYSLRAELPPAAGEPARVTTTALASRLGVAPGSVTGMMKKLAEHGLVTHTPYHGVELTATGEHIALELVRHHRLIELYLTHIVGFTWDEVHEQADALEHAISEEFEDRIAAALGDPTVDPHGDPIPTKEGVMPEPAAQSLAAWAVDGERWLVVTRVLTQNAALLRYLAGLELVPGARIALVGREPFGGSLRLGRRGAVECQISPAVAAVIFVAPADRPHDEPASGGVSK